MGVSVRVESLRVRWRLASTASPSLAPATNPRLSDRLLLKFFFFLALSEAPASSRTVRFLSDCWAGTARGVAPRPQVVGGSAARARALELDRV